MNARQTEMSRFPKRGFLKAILANLIWINVSEVFRYFIFVMDMMREALPQLDNVAPMNVGIFMVWGLWDTIIVLGITGFSWLFFERFGYGVFTAIVAGTLFWMCVFVVLWLGLLNMNLATLDILAIALPLALIEQIVAAIIVSHFLKVST